MKLTLLPKAPIIAYSSPNFWKAAGVLVKKASQQKIPNHF